MKQSEKGKQSKNFILEAATETFSKHGLDGMTVNAFCEEYDVSKGQFYHYFESKRILYDECLRFCVLQFVDFMKRNVVAEEDFYAAIHSYVRARGEFWAKYPVYERFMILAIVKESEDEKIAEILKPLNEYNHEVFREIIRKNKPKRGMSEDKAILYLDMTQEMCHSHLLKYGFKADNAEDTKKFQQLVEELLEILMNGIFEPNTK